MTGMTYRQPQTCSHPIKAQTLTGICHAARMFTFMHVCIYVYVSIGSLESDLLSQSIDTPGGTKWTFVYLLRHKY